MGFNVSYGTIPKPRAAVYVNGARRADTFCLNIDINHGIAGANAQLKVPRLVFDSDKTPWRDAEIWVYLGGTPFDAPTGEPDFVGYVSKIDAGFARGRNDVSLVARSASGWLHRVFLDQQQHLSTVTYNAPTQAKLAPGNIMAHVINRLPSGWGVKIKPGTTTVLNVGFSSGNTPRFDFINASFQEVLSQILGAVQTCSYRERYTSGGVTYFDFFQVNSWSNHVSTIRTGKAAGNLRQVPKVQEIETPEEADETLSRVIVYGRPKVGIVSAWSTPGDAPIWAGTACPAPLRRLWILNESFVKADPETAKEGSPSFLEESQFTFRRYGLPTALKDFTILENLPIVEVDETIQQTEHPVEVWKFYPELEEHESDDYQATGATRYERVKGAEFHFNEGYFTLQDPALYVSRLYIGPDGNPAKEYKEAVLGITIAAEPGESVYYDSGADQSELRFPWKADGNTGQIQKDEFAYSQLTSIDLINGLSAPLPAIFVDESGGWQIVATKVVQRNDVAKCQGLALRAQEQNRYRRKRYRAVYPFLTRAHKIGDRVTVEGMDDFDGGRYSCTAVRHDLTTGKTTIDFCNSIPSTIEVSI
jgi:hypothetical protein